MTKRIDPSLKEGLADGERMARMNVYVPPSLKRDAQRMCVETGENLSELVIRLLRAEVERFGAGR